MNEYHIIMDDINKHVIENLNHYLSTEPTEYAILLFGKWGVGKTFFINSYMENFNNNSDNPSQKLLKISLFGLKATDEINEKIFESFHPFLGNKYTKLATTFIKGALKFGFPIKDASIDVNLNAVNVADFFKNKKNFILVLDDLERTDIPLKEALGYINYLVELMNVKVILVANEGFILSSTWKEDYKAFKEKVIGKSFKITHDIDSILNTFLNTSNSLLQQQANMVKDIYLRSKYQNIRLLKQTINDFSFLIDHLNSLNTKYLRNNDFLTLLTKNFFILNIEAKQGSLTKQDLKKEIPFKRSNDQTSANYFNKYFIKDAPLFTGNLWEEIVFDFNFKNLEAELKSLPFFKKKPTRPKWLKLWYFQELENSAFDRLVKSFQSDFNSPKKPIQIAVYLHYIALMIFFTKNDLINDNIENIEKKVDLYITNYAKNKYTQYWNTNYILNGYSAIGYSFYNCEDKDFIRLHKKIVLAGEKLDEELNIINNKQLVNLTQKNLVKELYNIFEKSKWTPIFSDINAEDFTKNLVRAKNKDITYIGQLLYERYERQNYFNGKLYSFYLKEEQPFWQRVNEKIQAEIEKSEGVKQHILKKLTQSIEKIINILSSC